MKLFKKKDKDAKAKKKSKPEKGDDGGSSEGKKKKRGGGDGIVTLLTNHVEKILLGLAVLFALGMIGKGFTARTAIEGKAPKELQSKAAQAVSKMESYSWDSDFRRERDDDKQFLARSSATQEKISRDDYAIGQLIKPPMIPAKTLRTDPVLLAPQDLRVVTGFGPMVVKGVAPERPRDTEAPTRDNGGQAWQEWIDASGDVTRGVYFNAVTAAIPFAEQEKLFRPLKNTDGYKFERDQPKYLAWLLLREESIPGQKPKQSKISIRRLRQLSRQWGGSGSRNLDPDPKFMHEKLSCEVPPILLADMPRYAVHPKIPLFTEEPMVDEAGSKEPEGDGPVDEWGIDDGEDRAEEPVENVEKSNEDGPPEYLLFRYFDTDVKPGRTYRYSLMLQMDDPNRPRSGPSDYPRVDTLDQTVAERLASTKPGSGRVTPRSKPSNRVYIAPGNRIVAGKVAGPTFTSAKGGKFASNEPTAQIMATTFDQKTGASIPALETAFRGSVANYAKSAWYWPPIKNRAERVENHLFKTDSTVLDIRGGTELANSGLNAPGEMLIFDAKGRLSVVNELDDRSDFRSYFVPEPEVTRPGRDRDDEERPRRRNGRRGDEVGGGERRGPRNGGRREGPGRE